MVEDSDVVVPALLLEWKDAGHALRIAVTGYENPDCIDGDDANILVLDFQMARGDKSWRSRVPCMRANELPLLAVWMSSIAGGVLRARPRHFLCLDMDLKFYHRGKRDGKQRVIAVLRFSLAHTIGKRAVLSFLVDPAEMAATVERLKEASRRFPFRSEEKAP